MHWYTTVGENGRRSFLATARHFGIDERTLRDQAKRGRWLERASVHDAKLLERELDAGMAVQRRSVVRQVQIAERVDRLLERALERLESLGDDDDETLDEVTKALDLVKTAQRSQALMRTAVGLPTNSTRIDVKVDVKAGPDMSALEGLSEEEILLMDALEQARLKRLGGGNG